MPDNTGEKQEKTRFKKGQSGNPKGRPQGVRNKASQMAEMLFANDIQDICKAMIAQARSGNVQAAKIILDRLVPSRKDTHIKIKLPEVKNSNDILRAIECVTQTVACGGISTSEGEALARILDIHARAFELYEFESRLAKLEKREN
jgi:Family of unknown function (DUF5681)